VLDDGVCDQDEMVLVKKAYDKLEVSLLLSKKTHTQLKL
jgi:hypothetical protein